MTRSSLPLSRRAAGQAVVGSSGAGRGRISARTPAIAAATNSTLHPTTRGARGAGKVTMSGVGEMVAFPSGPMGEHTADEFDLQGLRPLVSRGIAALASRTVIQQIVTLAGMVALMRVL